MKQFYIFKCCVSIIRRVGFRSKIDFKKLSTFVGGNFFNRLSQCVLKNTIFRNFNHFKRCKQQKKDFQAIIYIIF